MDDLVRGDLVKQTIEFYDPELYALEAGVSYGREERHLFYADLAERIGGPVLEIGCGTGDILISVAKRGISTDGIDLSPRMIDYCTRRLRAVDTTLSALIRIRQADMRVAEYDRSYAGVFVPYHALYHLLSAQEIVMTLERIWSALRPNGVFAFDIFLLEADRWEDVGDGSLKKTSGDPIKTAWSRRAGVLSVQEEAIFVPETQRLQSKYMYSLSTVAGQHVDEWQRCLHYRISPVNELMEALRSTGFVDVEMCRLENPDTTEIVIIARKGNWSRL